MNLIDKPRSIETIGEEFLAIVWEDGHESFYEGPYLRQHCPCAGCRTGKIAPALRNPGHPGLALLAPRPRLVGLEEVGRYAVRLRWNDGHSAGLYEHRLLRALCPCEPCRAARGA